MFSGHVLEIILTCARDRDDETDIFTRVSWFCICKVQQVFLFDPYHSLNKLTSVFLDHNEFILKIFIFYIISNNNVGCKFTTYVIVTNNVKSEYFQHMQSLYSVGYILS